MTIVDILLVASQAAIGYGYSPGAWADTKNTTLGQLHSSSLVLLSVLLTLSAMEIIGLGMEWYQPKHVLQLGVIIALLYMEMIQCWVDQLCTWGGLLVFLLIPYRVNSMGWYASILADVREHPSLYRRYATQLIDHPLTHVAIVGLVVADFILIGIELLVDEGHIGGGDHRDSELAKQTLSRIRLSVYYTFAVEILLEIFVKGLANYFAMIENVVDALVVYACLILELTVARAAGDYVQFLMLIRLWRVFRIIYGVRRLMSLDESEFEHETNLVEQGVHVAQDKLKDVNQTVSQATAGVSDTLVETVAGVTGAHALSDEDVDAMHLEFKTLAYIVEQRRRRESFTFMSSSLRWLFCCWQYYRYEKVLLWAPKMCPLTV